MTYLNLFPTHLTPMLVSQIGCYAEAMESIPMNGGDGSTQDFLPLPRLHSIPDLSGLHYLVQSACR